MILYCKQNVLLKKNFFHVEGMIPVTAVLIRDSINPETQKNGIDLYRIDKKKMYILICSNTNDRNTWAKIIEDAARAQEEEEINKDKKDFVKENSTYALLGHQNSEVLLDITPKGNVKKDKEKLKWKSFYGQLSTMRTQFKEGKDPEVLIKEYNA